MMTGPIGLRKIHEILPQGKKRKGLYRKPVY